MIRRSRDSDRSSLFNIWSVCFGDSENYINFFLDNGYDKDGCFVWDEGGLPAAMLYLRKADYISGGKAKPVMYIYAAATLPDFRGRGIMARLIDTAVEYGGSKGCLFTFLLPASDSLYDYYERLGFTTAFEVKKALLSRGTLEKTVRRDFTQAEKLPGTAKPLTDAAREDKESRESIYMRRAAFFNPAVKWRKNEFEYAIAEWRFTGGDVLHFDGGYALCRERDGRVEIKETCGDFAKLSSALLSRYDCDTFLFLLPPYADFTFESQSARYGMLISQNHDTVLQVRHERPYVNLMLD